MSEMDLKNVLISIEAIKAVKALFVTSNPYLPVYSALGGAFVGAVSSIIPNLIINWHNYRTERRSTTLRLYAEIKAAIEVADYRGYIEHLEQIEEKLRNNKIPSWTYLVQVSDDRYPIYKSSLDQLGMIDVGLQVKIVEFYQLLEAIIQDIKPGGILNANPAPHVYFLNALGLAKRARSLGGNILATIEKQYNIPRITNFDS